MPIHDWTRVDAGVFHDFHLGWVSAIKGALNQGLLPPDHYALIEPVARLELDLWTSELDDAEMYARKRSRIAVRRSDGDGLVAAIEVVSPGVKSSPFGRRPFVTQVLQFLRDGIHLLVLDLVSQEAGNLHGIHEAIWSELPQYDSVFPKDKPLTLVAYSAGKETQAYVESLAVGDVLTSMPLFLEPDRYVQVPLETTYLSAFAGVPKRWRDELGPT